MNRDEEFLAKRIIDLADQSYRTGLYTYTGFLNQQEQAVYDSVRKDAAPVTATLFGGRSSGLEIRKVWDMMRDFQSAALRSVR